MQQPDISQYADSMANPAGLLKTLAPFETERDDFGEVKFRAGNNAVVFRVRSGNAEKMVKCYIKHHAGLSHIYAYTASLNDPLLASAQYFPDELYVLNPISDGNYHGIVVADWIEGNSLETEIKRAAREYGPTRFRELSDAFDKLAGELLSRPWAHGDLKPENIIVDQSTSMTLIDYDAMYVPGSETPPTMEVGTPGFQHPARDENTYGKHIDDYSIALISASLKALALDTTLYDRYHRGDNLILNPIEIEAGTSAAYNEILDMFAREGMYREYSLALMLRSATPVLERVNELFRNHGTMACGIIPELIAYGSLWGYADHEGRMVIEPVFREASEFREGYAGVEINGYRQLIDMTGKASIRSGFEMIKPPSNGLCSVCTGGKWGFAKVSGEMVIQACYDNAGSIHENRAAVCLNGKWGFIDSAGEIVVVPIYDTASDFRNGVAIVTKDGKIFRLDAAGKLSDENPAL